MPTLYGNDTETSLGLQIGVGFGVEVGSSMYSVSAVRVVCWYYDGTELVMLPLVRFWWCLGLLSGTGFVLDRPFVTIVSYLRCAGVAWVLYTRGTCIVLAPPGLYTPVLALCACFQTIHMSLARAVCGRHHTVLPIPGQALRVGVETAPTLVEISPNFGRTRSEFENIGPDWWNSEHIRSKSAVPWSI